MVRFLEDSENLVFFSHGPILFILDKVKMTLNFYFVK